MTRVMTTTIATAVVIKRAHKYLDWAVGEELHLPTYVPAGVYLPWPCGFEVFFCFDVFRVRFDGRALVCFGLFLVCSVRAARLR